MRWECPVSGYNVMVTRARLSAPGEALESPSRARRAAAAGAGPRATARARALGARRQLRGAESAKAPVRAVGRDRRAGARRHRLRRLVPDALSSDRPPRHVRARQRPDRLIRQPPGFFLVAMTI